MKNRQYVQFLYIGVALLTFSPFLYYGFISSDWDSYASIASGNILILENIYIPSRPPGFPIYEIILAPLSLINTRIALIIHFIFGVFLFLLVESDINKSNEKALLLFLFFTSSIYFISSFTIIDYVIGCFFGYVGLNSIKQDKLYFGSIMLIISSGIRLSNIIFLLASVAFLIVKKEYKKGYLIFTLSAAVIALIYVPSYLIADGFCFLNLTNTDHSLIGRLGRYFYKQLQIFGLVGSFIFLIALFKGKGWKSLFIEENIPYLIIFFAFQFSFLRLPTEQGHLLPAFVAFIYLIRQLEINKYLLALALFFSIFSNFYTIEILKPDIPNHATSADFGLFVEKGYLLKNLDERIEKGQNYRENINQSKLNIKLDWNNGGPNC